MNDIYTIPLELLRSYLFDAKRNDFRAVAKLTELFGSVDQADQFLAQQVHQQMRRRLESRLLAPNTVL
ncbi:hypothetical protein K0504_04830 [Neiella marina]|uniref:Uncharacterized protein n=1 Tax=Neiella holothuriorum TaxID=2870530 RepID=A0ABS7EDE1_9GAMM|nr:hypothetical protein [Neiella holothuriorum]MBW8190353.1 hypothetical protein [Neiella holothuriorum]